MRIFRLYPLSLALPTAFGQNHPVSKQHNHLNLDYMIVATIPLDDYTMIGDHVTAAIISLDDYMITLGYDHMILRITG
ncbi:hypothetical protein K504DRAFT_498302 [Pleomassaria siparia CBS 279.74]|uniref:Uncharacterized protein n=1 Tax=Pleomassaria siparia CBS 279.74 TaxID=1314801 RepID=A0A6G1KM74_9PLEO|nr:hypothetical protein K504DRAFT_498302 [Pleomassaria siparia CBS 279.74]